MNLLSKDLRDFFIQNSIDSGVSGIYEDEQAEREDQICIYNTGGIIPDYSFNAEEIIDNPTASIHSIHRNRNDAEAKLLEIRELINSTTNTKIGDYFYLQFWVTSDISYISRDSENRVLYSINIRAKRRKE
jgi:hypothetical protein